ncbi:MAG: hypothetical protein M3Q63_01905 [bacterium]|nr:hypothetical protein [bacterium]
MDTQPTSNHTENKERKQTNTALKIIVLIGLIALLIVGILLPIKLVPNAVTSIKNGFTSLFGTDSKVTLLTDKKEIQSGEPFTLTWNGRLQKDGSYVLTYSCTPGVEVQTSVNIPNQKVPCDTPYYFSPRDNSITIVIISENDQSATVPVNLGFLANNSNETEVVGDTTFAINNASIPTTPTPVATSTPRVPEPTIPATSTPATSTPRVPEPTTPTPSKPTPTTPSQPQAPAIADLAVSILTVTYPTQDQVTVKFNVSNVGTKSSGTWNLKATMPSKSNPVYTALNQKSLNPQDGIIYTLTFDRNAYSTNNTVTITADYDNRVTESNNSNNTLSMQISGTTVQSGKADLTIKTLRTGVLSSSGKFIETDSVGYADKTAVQIEVVNNGSVATGVWKFTADLPTSGSYSFYTSPTQKSLAPGAKAILTLGYDLQEDYGNKIIIDIDSNDDVNELNESNNEKSVTLDID